MLNSEPVAEALEAPGARKEANHYLIPTTQ